MTTNRLKLLSLVVIAWSSIIVPEVVLASQSKAQLYMPWPMLNTKLNTVLSGANSHFSTKVPTSQLDAGGILWTITNTTYSATTNNPVSRTNGSVIDFEASHSSLKVTIDKIAVDQIIERVVNGTIVRIRLVADCGPLTFTQPNASASSSFNIDWSSGSPNAILKKSDLNWAANSWVIPDFQCNGPQGLPEILKEQISARLKNADDFKPYLTEFVTEEVQTTIKKTLNTIREPLTVKAASSRQTFKVGTLFNTPYGVIADLTMSDSSKSPALPPIAPPSAEVLNSLSTSTPSLLAGKEFLEQLIRAELNYRASSMKSDLQSFPAFHELMQDRLKQLFGWKDLRNYPKNAPFPLTIFKPKFESIAITEARTLKTTFDLNGVVQSYRSNQWWNWLAITGKTSAEVKLSVARGKVSYATALTPVTTNIDYTAVYRKQFDKDSRPPSDKIIGAVTGNQPALSGSFTFPVIELAKTGSYSLSSMNWLSSSKFVLNWQQQ